MEALKLIPQTFFEFFARLVPGAVAFAIWMTLFDGARKWPAMLQAVAAGGLNEDNAAVFALFVAVSIAYVLGQLVAPLGKVSQRISEFLAVPVARILIEPRNWARGVMGKDAIELPERKILKLAADDPQVGREDSKAAKKSVQAKKNNYDFLRANAPELGALVAKIRSEYTMFNALTAIFAIAAVTYATVQSEPLSPTLYLLIVGALVCACRGYFVEKTMGETASKLRSAWDQARTLRPNQIEPRPPARPSRESGRSVAKKELMSALDRKRT